MKVRLVVILCTILLGLFAFGQMGIVMAAGSEKQVPFGASIEDGDLDGVLGEEWADAESFSTRIGSYRANVYMKHDGKYWYIALTKQGRIRGGTVTLWMCFDASGDGKLYSKGNDSLMLPETDGRLVRDIDYAYTRSMKAPKKDTSVGGTNDKIGAGKFSDNTYVFEIKIEMNSARPPSPRLASKNCPLQRRDVTLTTSGIRRTNMGNRSLLDIIRYIAGASWGLSRSLLSR